MAQNHCLHAPQIRWITELLKSKRIKLDQSFLEDKKEIVNEEEIAIHNILARDRRSVIFTVVVTPQPDPPLNFEELRSICRTSGLICPIGHICYRDSNQKGNRDIVALVYHPFKTMHCYLDNFSTTDASFVGFMKGITKGLYNLQKNGYGPASINCNTLVMGDDDREGSLLLISVRKEGRTNKVCNEEFQRLQMRIGRRVVKEKTNRDFDALLMCMSLAYSPAQRSRLVQAPYFSSDDEKVYVFLSKLYIAMWSSTEFKFHAEKIKVNSGKLVNYLRKQSEHKDVEAVWDTTDQKVMRNAFEVCMFLRNCIYHLNKEHSNIVGSKEVTPLLRDSKLFIAFMEQLLPDLLSTLFTCTFRCKYPIFLFDYTHSPDGQLVKRVGDLGSGSIEIGA